MSTTPTGTDVAEVKATQSERFTAAVIKEFSTNNGAVTLTPFQKKLCQNYFIKIDQTLKDAEKKRMAKGEQYRDDLPLTWENVNMSKLAIDVIAYSSVELDPTQANHINMIPYKNTANNKYDMGFVIGYRGMELKAKKYGLEVPTDVVVELVYAKDVFKQFKKDKDNDVERYSFQIVDNFDRGAVVGGFWYHEFADNPQKNKLKVFSLKDIEKRKPAYASAEFWGGEKDIWKSGKKTGEKEKIEGWFEEMAIKTIARNAYNAITIDNKKIDDNYLAIIQKETEMKDSIIQNEIDSNANTKTMDFSQEENAIEVESETVVEEVAAISEESPVVEEKQQESAQEDNQEPTVPNF